MSDGFVLKGWSVCYPLCYRQAILPWVTGITQSTNPQTGFILNGTESEMMTPENSSQLQKQQKFLIPNCRLLCWSWGPDGKVGRSDGVVERAAVGALSGLATRWPCLVHLNFLVLKCSCRYLPGVVLHLTSKTAQPVSAYGVCTGNEAACTECRNWGSNSRCWEEESPPKALKARGLK